MAPLRVPLTEPALCWQMLGDLMKYLIISCNLEMPPGFQSLLYQKGSELPGAGSSLNWICFMCKSRQDNWQGDGRWESQGADALPQDQGVVTGTNNHSERLSTATHLQRAKRGNFYSCSDSRQVPHQAGKKGASNLPLLVGVS